MISISSTSSAGAGLQGQNCCRDAARPRVSTSRLIEDDSRRMSSGSIGVIKVRLSSRAISALSPAACPRSRSIVSAISEPEPPCRPPSSSRREASVNRSIWVWSEAKNFSCLTRNIPEVLQCIRVCLLHNYNFVTHANIFFNRVFGTVSVINVFSTAHLVVTKGHVQTRYALRHARPHDALGNVHRSRLPADLPGELQRPARGLRDSQTPRHGPGDDHRPRLDRGRRATRQIPGFFPKRGDQLP